MIEKAALVQQLEHIHQMDLFPDLQSAYRPYHSTETALLKVTSDILMSMDKKQVTLLVLLDLSAVFDTIDHSILEIVLEKDYGITGDVLAWVSSYLENRTQRVQLQSGVMSEPRPLNYGVPQGSCYGPVAFLLYASQLFAVMQKHLPQVHVYADDTQLYLAFNPSQDADQWKAVTETENCVKDLRAWMLSNKLKINDSKTEFMLLGSKSSLAKVCVNSIQVGECVVQKVPYVQNLGVWLDEHLDMQLHITKQCQKVMMHLQDIRSIRKCLTTEATRSLLHAFVTSCLDYGNSLLIGVPKVHISKLQMVQNMAVRCLHNLNKYDHITSYISSEHWLTVDKRIKFKLMLIIYKCLNNQGPKYLNDMLMKDFNTIHNLRSNSDTLRLVVPRTTSKSYGDRAFMVAGPRLWNSLPLSLRSVKDTSRFKSRLKTYLFNL